VISDKNQESRIKSQESRIKKRESRGEKREARTKKQELRARNQETHTKNYLLNYSLPTEQYANPTLLTNRSLITEPCKLDTGIFNWKLNTAH
jgi:hypothetical protein